MNARIFLLGLALALLGSSGVVSACYWDGGRQYCDGYVYTPPGPTVNYYNYYDAYQLPHHYRDGYYDGYAYGCVGYSCGYAGGCYGSWCGRGTYTYSYGYAYASFGFGYGYPYYYPPYSRVYYYDDP